MCPKVVKITFLNAQHTLCLFGNNICNKKILIILGDLASFDKLVTMLDLNELPSSCTLLELDAVTKTTFADNFARNISGLDGLIYDNRRLMINLEFRTGLFMKMEQKKDYSG